MQNFLILIREDVARVKAMSEEEMQKDIQAYTEWVESLAKTGNYLSGEPLESYGRYITRSEVLSDGPFIEAKEAVTGYIIIQAEDIEKAVALTRSCPVFLSGGALELRPIMKF